MQLNVFKPQKMFSLALLSALIGTSFATPSLAHPGKAPAKGQVTHKPTAKFIQKSSVYSPIAKPQGVLQVQPDQLRAMPVNQPQGEISIYFPAEQVQHPEVKFVIEMSCPPGETITHLSYQPDNQAVVPVLTQATPFNNYTETRTAQLSTTEKINQVYQKLDALHEDFAQGTFPTNLEPKASNHAAINVQGKCSGGLQVKQQQFNMLGQYLYR